jgi:hypothetical protein
MNIKFPKGFFETLSEKCQKEIQDKAKVFKIETYDRIDNIRLGLNDHHFPSHYPEIRHEYSKSVRKSFSAGIFVDTSTFDFEQDILKKLFDTEKQISELNKLKESIANIKEFIK